MDSRIKENPERTFDLVVQVACPSSENEVLLEENNSEKLKLVTAVVVVFIPGLGPRLLTTDLWIDDRHGPFFPMLVHGDLASLFSPLLSSAQLCWLLALWMLRL
ncbi:hypothetical protein AMECASPLE_018306 [Ameca splendens]|uniref:Uncharacterized protein n=1 Tax=Ameca splendens TaxID=208324 RepID=A0ABV0Y2H1_9TELE